MAGDEREAAAAEEPEQQELVPLDGAERLDRVQRLREDLAESGPAAVGGDEAGPLGGGS